VVEALQNPRHDRNAALCAWGLRHAYIDAVA
jgi:hypothetical protein